MTRLLAIALLSTSACTFAAPRHRTMGTVADLTMVAGAAVAMPSTCPDTAAGCHQANDLGKTVGVALIAAGAVIGLVAVALPAEPAAAPKSAFDFTPPSR